MRNKAIAIIILFILVAGGVAAWLYSEKKQPAAVKEIKIDRSLTAEQQKIYTDRINKSREYIGSLDPNQNGYKLELSNAYLDIGQQYYGLGEISRALGEYHKALELSRENVNALIAMSLAQTEAGDYLGARSSLEKAKQIVPAVADIWLRYIQLAKDHFPENANDIDDYYDQALKATNRHPDILASYAQYAEGKGDTEKAKALWKEAAAAVPQNQLYLQEYKRLGGK